MGDRWHGDQAHSGAHCCGGRHHHGEGRSVGKCGEVWGSVGVVGGVAWCVVAQALWGQGAYSSATGWAGAGALLWRQALQHGVTPLWGVGMWNLRARLDGFTLPSCQCQYVPFPLSIHCSLHSCQQALFPLNTLCPSFLPVCSLPSLRTCASLPTHCALLSQLR